MKTPFFNSSGVVWKEISPAKCGRGLNVLIISEIYYRLFLLTKVVIVMQYFKFCVFLFISYFYRYGGAYFQLGGGGEGGGEFTSERKRR